MEKLYTVNKNKTRSWLWLRPWTPYCQIQTEIEESRQNHWTIQIWYKTNPLKLYSGSNKQIQGITYDRVPEELWMEVCDILQEEGIKTIPKKKKCKKAKWLCKEALQIADKRREAKGKKEKERYTQMQNSKE